jgi:hypothetical protein
MAMFDGIGQSRRGSGELGPRPAGAVEPTRRPGRSSLLGIGTLACRRCDAPVAVGDEPVLVTDHLTCPFCAHRGPARDFLSLAPPSRPARVQVRLVLPAHLGARA